MYQSAPAIIRSALFWKTWKIELFFFRYFFHIWVWNLETPYWYDFLIRDSFIDELIRNIIVCIIFNSETCNEWLGGRLFRESHISWNFRLLDSVYLTFQVFVLSHYSKSMGKNSPSDLFVEEESVAKVRTGAVNCWRL